MAADPNLGALLRNLASAHRGAGDEEAELAALDRALDIDRRDLVAWMRKAELHQRREEKGEAFEAWNGALAAGRAAPSVERADGRSAGAGRALRRRGRSGHPKGRSIDDRLGPIVGELDEAELRRSKAFVDAALGQRRIYTNECHGLCYPFLPADEFFDDKHFPWFGELSARPMRSAPNLTELIKDPGEALRPYVRMESGIGENKWSGSTTASTGARSSCGNMASPTSRCSIAARKLPRLLEFATGVDIPGRAPSAFFSMLKPRKRIPPHTGVTNTRAIIHLPLIVPEGCGFRVGGEAGRGSKASPSRSTTRSNMRRGTTATSFARC